MISDNQIIKPSDDQLFRRLLGGQVAWWHQVARLEEESSVLKRATGQFVFAKKERKKAAGGHMRVNQFLQKRKKKEEKACGHMRVNLFLPATSNSLLIYGRPEAFHSGKQAKKQTNK